MTPRELRELYHRGQNVLAELRRESGTVSSRDIELAYDLQAGSYVALMRQTEMAVLKDDYAGEVVRVLRSLGGPEELLEAGVGEATTLSGVLEHLGPAPAWGFDLSWSRLAVARRWLQERGLGAALVTGDLFRIPFADNAIDIVYTSHSIEPNRGGELAIISELLRVARRYLVLLEPGYELASDEARARMDHHGYCRALVEAARAAGGEVVRHELFPVRLNPMNPTALTVVRKPDPGERPAQVLACPRFRTPLEDLGEVFYSPEALAVYPVIGGIPCLRIENAITASGYPRFIPKSR